MTRRTIVCSTAVLVAMSVAQTRAQEPAAPAAAPTANPIDYATARFERIAHALRIDEHISIDGRLSEPAWERAEPATHFVQWEPNPGRPASQDTDVRFLYDARNLYIGVRCWDSEPSRLTVTELREDFDPQGDNIGIFLDTLHDLRSGFTFWTNPAGARRDFQVFDDDNVRNQDWDGVWDVKTTIDEKGWTAEFVIPFKTFRFSSSPKQEWGLNVVRRVQRDNEDAHWSPLPRRYRNSRASMAGTLTGLEGIRQGRNLKIKPFVIASVTQLPSKQFRRDPDANGGIDFKYGLTQSLTLDLTYRTDFSQVEADQQQINLTRFNQFFPEKREFFLENFGIFGIAAGGGGAAGGGTNLSPFFSRRIGLSAAGTPIPIVGGARVSGRVGQYDIGLLAMKTERDGAVPSNNFVVGRLRRIFAGNSAAGAVVTSRDSMTPGDYNRLYGVDALLRFYENLEVTSYLLQTETPRRRGQNAARLLGAAWRGNDFTVEGQYDDVQPNFVPDVGFVRRRDMSHYSGNVSVRPRPRNNAHIRNFSFDAGSDYYADPRGRVETREHTAGTGISFQDGASLRVGATSTFDRLAAPFTIQRPVVLPAGDYQYSRYSASYSANPARPLGGSVNASVGEFWDGRSWSVGGAVELKPNYHVNVSMTFSRNDVTLPQGTFVTTLVGTRVLWAFTSKAFLNSFLQYNATTNQFSANTRFNIIHRPLSDLYIVYNERRDTNSGSLLERGLVVKFTDMFDF